MGCANHLLSHVALSGRPHSSRAARFLFERAMSMNSVRPGAIVVGANDVGSAIAVALHHAGFGIVLCDEVDPAWMRRGMAFTNAWYVGSAELDAVGAVFCASARSIPTILSHGELVAATTWSWTGVAALLAPVVIVHTSWRERNAGDLRAPGPDERLTIGVGPGFVAGGNVDLAIESAPGPALGEVIRSGPALPMLDIVPDLAGAGRERFVRAHAGGRFMTGKRIGMPVVRGEAVGAIGDTTILAPLAGVLRGLTARGARVAEGTRVVEIDPRGEPALCFGIGERPHTIAAGVLEALSLGETPTMPLRSPPRLRRALTA
jgi:xanthine dehydrogenase accessory factor